MTRSPLRLLTVVSLVLVVAGFASGVLADGKPVLRLHAYSVDLNAPRARTNGLEIAIEHWSTPEEAARLRAILAEKGPDALLDALRSMKPRAGYIRPDTGIGWDITPLWIGGLVIFVAGIALLWRRRSEFKVY